MPEDFKIVAVINKNLETGVALNAIAHMGAGLVASASETDKQNMHFMNFVDKSSKDHNSISALSLVVLRWTSGEIRKVRSQAEEENLHLVDFLETMTGDTYKEQLQKTSAVVFEELNFYGVMLFGKRDVIDPITKKLSLRR